MGQSFSFGQFLLGVAAETCCGLGCCNSEAALSLPFAVEFKGLVFLRLKESADDVLFGPSPTAGEGAGGCCCLPCGDVFLDDGAVLGSSLSL